MRALCGHPTHTSPYAPPPRKAHASPYAGKRGTGDEATFNISLSSLKVFKSVVVQCKPPRRDQTLQRPKAPSPVPLWSLFGGFTVYLCLYCSVAISLSYKMDAVFLIALHEGGEEVHHGLGLLRALR